MSASRFSSRKSRASFAIFQSCADEAQALRDSSQVRPSSENMTNPFLSPEDSTDELTSLLSNQSVMDNLSDRAGEMSSAKDKTFAGEAKKVIPLDDSSKESDEQTSLTDEQRRSVMSRLREQGRVTASQAVSALANTRQPGAIMPGDETAISSPEQSDNPFDDDYEEVVPDQFDSIPLADISKNKQVLRRETRKISKDAISAPVLLSSTNPSVVVSRSTSDNVVNDTAHNMDIGKSTTVPNFRVEEEFVGPTDHGKLGHPNLVSQIKNNPIVRKVMDAKDAIIDRTSTLGSVRHFKAKSESEMKLLPGSDNMIGGGETADILPVHNEDDLTGLAQREPATQKGRHKSHHMIGVPPALAAASKKLSALTNTSSRLEIPREVESRPKLQQFFGTNNMASSRGGRNRSTNDFASGGGSPRLRRSPFPTDADDGTSDVETTTSKDWVLINQDGTSAGLDVAETGYNAANNTDTEVTEGLSKTKNDETASQAEFDGLSVFPDQTSRISHAKSIKPEVELHPSVYGVGEIPKLNPSFNAAMSALRGNPNVTTFLEAPKSSNNTMSAESSTSKAGVHPKEIPVEIHPSYYGKAEVPQLNPAFNPMVSPLGYHPNVMDFAEAPPGFNGPEASSDRKGDGKGDGKRDGKRDGMVVAKSPLKGSKGHMKFVPERFRAYRDSLPISEDSDDTVSDRNSFTGAKRASTASKRGSAETSAGLSAESAEMMKQEGSSRGTALAYQALTGGKFEGSSKSSEGSASRHTPASTASTHPVALPATRTGMAALREKLTARFGRAQASYDATHVAAASAWSEQLDQAFNPSLECKLSPSYAQAEESDDEESDAGLEMKLHKKGGK